MTNTKEKYAFWLTPEAKKMIEINAPLANCGSQSEFVEKAVRFYDGYLKVQNAGAFLPHAVADVLEGSLGVYSHCNYTELLVSGGIPMALIYYAGQVGAFIYAARALKRAKAADTNGENLAARRLVFAFCVFLAARFVLDIAVVSYFERQDAVFSVLLIASARLLSMGSGAKEGDALRAGN